MEAISKVGPRDGRGRRRWTGSRPGVRRSAMPALTAVLALAGCAGASVAPAGEPLPDPAATAAALVSATAATERSQITFNWTLEESGSRVRGRGVVRLQAPDRLRLDLFGPRNETYLSAALLGGEPRLPASAPADVPIPSPALLWAGLGVVRPPDGAVVEGASSSGDDTILRYREPGGGDLYEYVVQTSPAPRLRQLQRVGPRGPIETVRLERSDAGDITRATYRDWSAFRDLTLEIESRTPADAFDESIWTP